ncbi:saccharopine dehydrogenase NADP-binding domain-containing protein [Arthrobacter zhangbolii]|uniref:Saccharopine dehydrogenase NADP-binding domain-containing protein n=1 Tax=Arthrobacter zhangbolii TaxID=2886936 RepID=A0A9X1M8C0_9MICC|nr:saccharopine dehydrogenase NADP-binding domain-containing protein [Arthrobacter zhangbolii]MCC3272209.1 saccharopine dehydrogenase NADP-binding domain-containing protein [Arthrobacter zhangbolii]UON91921.1 saccharopine dehydrogenase NADP-binding domain-containing protein [Arthrobacter zhangbolii]
MSGRIVLLGATGYTGGLVLGALFRRGLRPVLAGRNTDALAGLAEEHGGLEFAAADATDPASVRRLLDPGDVLITTAGPFERVGLPVAEAAVRAGARYIDTTGEVGFVRTLQERFHRQAQDTGAVLLPAFGYDYVPGILAGAMAAQQAGDAGRKLDVGYFTAGALNPGLSQGTRATMRDGLFLPAVRFANGRLVEERAAAEVHDFPVSGARRSRKAGFLVPGTEVLFLPKAFPQLDAVSVYNGWFADLSRAISLMSAASHTMARSARGRRLLERLTAPMLGKPGGPDSSQRAKTRTQVVATVTGTDGNLLAAVQLTGPNVYTLTGELIAWGAEQLRDRQDLTPGVAGPLDAFGLDGLTRGCAALGLVPVESRRG